MPSVARLAARTGPVRAVTGTADPRYVPAANAPARQSVGAEPHAHAPPPRCGQGIDQPPQWYRPVQSMRVNGRIPVHFGT